MSADTARQLLHSLRVSLAIGSDDQFITVLQVQQQQQLLQELGAAAEVFSFVGRHELNRVLLEKLAG